MAKSAFKTHSWNIVLVVIVVLGWCLLLPLLITFFLPLYIWKTLVISFTRIVHPELKPISGADAIFATDNVVEDRDPEHGRNVLVNIGACLELEASSIEIDRTVFAQHLDNALLQNKDLEEYAWKLKCNLVRYCGYTFRKETSRFSILNHVKKIELTSEQNLLEYLNAWITKPYDTPDMPLWEFLILKSNSKDYIAYKFHHTLADGLSLHQISSIIFQAETSHLIQRTSGNSISPIPQLDKVKIKLDTNESE